MALPSRIGFFFDNGFGSKGTPVMGAQSNSRRVYRVTRGCAGVSLGAMLGVRLRADPGWRNCGDASLPCPLLCWGQRGVDICLSSRQSPCALDIPIPSPLVAACQIARYVEELSAERLSREVMDERKTKEIKAVESSISLDLTSEKRARKDLESKMIKLFDETAFSLRLDLAREKKLREEAEERHEKEVADEIIRIADTVDQERKQRLDGEETLLKRLNDEVYRLTDIIAQEQTTRKVRPHPPLNPTWCSRPYETLFGPCGG